MHEFGLEGKLRNENVGTSAYHYNNSEPEERLFYKIKEIFLS